jgi:predicted CXXCH cytochrome family protein
MLLRVKNTAGELCISCHTDKTRGPEFGTHPTGGMPWPIPQALVEAGAKVGPNPRELTCQVCHTPHGARFDHLLVMGTNSNQLCLTCHDQMRPGMFREGGPREHPLSPKVNAEQAAAIANMGTKLGPEGELICLSCHKLHHGFGQRFMLADDLAEGQMCLRCHSARAEMIGSAHDLRTNAPQERNRLGMTPMTGGPCSSCHLFHRYARELASTPLDRSGECVTCHQPGRCAERKVLASPNHPVDQCTDCHNPHETRYGSFLKQRTPDVCESCHSEKSSVLGSAHDASGDPAAWAGSGTYAADACLACHRPHGDPEHGLFRAAPSASGAGADAPCLACHSEAEWNGPGPIAALHTTDAPADRSALTLPLNDAPTLLAPRIGCRTCHDPHGGDGAMPLLRASSEAGGAGLCTTCHTAMASIVLTAHAPDRLAAAGFEARACGPCHLAHGDPCEVNPRLLWPIALAGAPIAADATRVTDPCCVGCHSPDGAAPAPAIATHPDVPMFSPAVADSPSALPLFAADGTRDAQGQIACRTCHLPHGRPELARVADAAPPAALRAMRPQLRSFEPPNACTNCHSTEALRRFLYFHDPQRRAEWAAEGVSGGPPRPAPAQAETAAPSPVPAPVR